MSGLKGRGWQGNREAAPESGGASGSAASLARTRR